MSLLKSDRCSRREFLKFTGLGAASLCFGGCGHKRAFAAAESNVSADSGKPNIVFIMADDLGYGDLGCYGATKVRTQNIDSLAADGMRFTDSHSPSAVCSPTRYGVLTGRYCWRTSLKEWVCWPDHPLLIDTKRLTVASLLKSAGYRTGCVGKWHLGFGEKRPEWNYGLLKPGPLEIGFDYYYGVPTSGNWPPYVYVENHRVVGQYERGHYVHLPRLREETGEKLTRKAVEFIDEAGDKPFFLYFSTCSVHRPYTPSRRFKGSSGVGLYGDFIHQFDWSVGEVSKALDRKGIADNTLIMVTSDNGARVDYAGGYGHKSCGEFRGQKADIYEGGHRVPFVARWPGRIPSGKSCDELMCLTDLFATCAEIVGKSMPAGAGEDSYSILDVLLNKKRKGPVREAIVHHSLDGMFAIRQGNWKLIMGRGSGGFTKPIRIKAKPGEPMGQLYDLKDDPKEQINLWDNHPEIVDRLSSLLVKYKSQGYSRPMVG